MISFMKRKKFVLLIVILLLFFVIDHREDTNYNEPYDYVLSYLHNTYGENYTISDCSFSHYDYGFTAGLYIYSFDISDSQGISYKATYDSHCDLDETTVSNLILEAVNTNSPATDSQN